jgi:hypothetical protein
VNCCVRPLTTDGFAGVTAIDWRVAGVTLSTVEPVTLLNVAPMLLVPTPAAVASPPLVIVATLEVAEAHVAEAVRFCVLLSLYVPVAVNCCVWPLVTDEVAGVTEIEESTTALTVSVALPCTAPEVTAIVVTPGLTPLANPALFTVEMEFTDTLQAAVDVRFCVLPSVYVPAAVNCCVAPAEIDAEGGVTAMEISAGGPTVIIVDPHTEPAHALAAAEPPAAA